MKIAVYTIALNEREHAERWAQSASDADYRVVADTGSSDGTAEVLGSLGVQVHSIWIRPWRFDDARNAALALIPADADVCITMDMDEYLEPGWRQHLERVWTPGMTALSCRLALREAVDQPDAGSKIWPAKKFHSRAGYRFRRAVHETIFFVGEDEKSVYCPEITISHVQDRGKGTRANYLPLMEVARREEPNDSQLAFWLGRDLMYAGRPEEAVRNLREYLSLAGLQIWGEERAEAMLYLSDLEPENRSHWLERSRQEAPHRREVWLRIAEDCHHRGDWLNLFWACSNGLISTRRTGSYLDDASAWNFRLHDLGALSCWHLGNCSKAVEWGRAALDMDPGNDRLKRNLEVFEGALREQLPVHMRSSSHLATSSGVGLSR